MISDSNSNEACFCSSSTAPRWRNPCGVDDDAVLVRALTTQLPEVAAHVRMVAMTRAGTNSNGNGKVGKDNSCCRDLFLDNDDIVAGAGAVVIILFVVLCYDVWCVMMLWCLFVCLILLFMNVWK